MNNIIAGLRSAQGWRRAGWAFLCGGVLSLSMPPYNLFPLLWIGLPFLIFLLQSAKNLWQAFVTGWIFAFGFFVFSLYWIAASTMVDLKAFWWAIPFAVFGLPAFFALYYGIAAALAWRIGMAGVAGAVRFGLLWFAADDARGHMFTGFPWNLTGYAWSGVLPVLQTASFAGIYGLSLLTCVGAALPASLIANSPSARRAVAASFVLFVALAAWGEVRLQTTHVGTVPGVRLRVVQPDIPQAGKWRISQRAEDFAGLLDLTAAPPAAGQKPPNYIIWPETASTYYLSEDAFHRDAIAARLSPDADLITGVIRRDLDGMGNTRFYNSMVVIDAQGRLVAGYDKAHLVPFGEYMPFRKYIPIEALAASGGDFTPGPGPRTLRIIGLPPFSPLICYEAIFPGHVVVAADRPSLMINITNDGWYGDTIGPYQHFAIVRVRTIEEGLPLVRAANTGISGIIDPLGRVNDRLGLEKRGFIDGSLPAPLPLTFYAKWRDMPALVAFIFLFLMTLAAPFLKRKMAASSRA
ncbi:MAG: apolipoprotein N-acyltransferase [Alphaproteobacteria bacterium]|nr:apolipoprotein N-acyltransferase [Alphaproteobacteria bacterium]